MRLLFVADGRSPIALNWIRHFVERGDEVFLASTFHCTPELRLDGIEVTPVAYSGLGSRSRRSNNAPPTSFRSLATLRHWLGPLTIPRAAKRLRGFAERVQPDLIHAMRIPFEGMLAADAYGNTPLLVSIWGNDLTLHAPASPLMRHYTAWTLRVSDALHADCRRDVRLARQWGFATTKRTVVVPGAGGIRSEIFFPAAEPTQAPIVINPRGARAYVRNDVFFKAIPLVLRRKSDARFLCVALAGNRQAERWVDQLEIRHAVQLLPALSQRELAEQFRRAQVLVSPSVHDGTPNTLLEGMACGCLPVAGDLESIREWIKHQANGLLFAPTNPEGLAESILRGLENENLRRAAAGLNREIVAERADYSRCMRQVEDFYRRLVSNPPL